MPSTPPALRAPLPYHRAGAGQYIGPTAQEAIRAALARRPGRELHVYPGRGRAQVAGLIEEAAG